MITEILESDRALAAELTRADCAMWPKSREFFIEEAARKIADYRDRCIKQSGGSAMELKFNV